MNSLVTSRGAAAMFGLILPMVFVAESLGFSPAIAADTTATPTSSLDVSVKSPDVVPQNTWEIGAGYLGDLHKNGSNSSYYLLTYKGQTLASEGTPFTDPNILAPPKFADVQSSQPGTNQTELKLERGMASVDSGILDAIARKPIPIKIKLAGLESFLGTAGISSTADFKHISYLGGIETPNLHLLDFLNSKALHSNAVTWIYASVLNENQNSSDSSATPKDHGLLSYRSFLGRGFNPVPAAQSAEIRDKLISASLAELDKKVDLGPGFKYDDVKTLRHGFDKDNMTILEHTIADIVDNNLYGVSANTTGPEFGNIVRHFLQLRLHIKRDQPSQALWWESAGWYQFTGSATGNRFTNLMAVNLQIYFHPELGENNWILLRFEDGKERAVPNVYNHFASLSTGFSF